MRIMRQMVDGLTNLVGVVNRRRKLDVPQKHASEVKVNLGCGLAIAPGWINIDGSLNALIANMPKMFHTLAYRLSGARRYYSEMEYCEILGINTFVHHDLAYSIPLHDGSTDFVYSSHFLEHLAHKDAQNLLSESFRILKPGGVVRISVPDLEYALSLYTLGRKEEMLTQYFFVNDDDSHFARHKYMYDFQLLKAALEKAGFQDVRRCAFQEGRTPDLIVLDNRVEDSLFVEATR